MIASTSSPFAIHDASPEMAGGARVLQVAFACHPDHSMESRNGWRRATHAARRHRVTLIYGDSTPVELLQRRAEEEGVGDRLELVPVQAGVIGKRWLRSATTYYAGLRLWHRSAYAVAKQLHAAEPFDLVHQTTFCGYREPGYCWKLGVPFVWGPVGGTHAFPARFLGQLSCPRTLWIELCRNAINAWQLRFSRHVRHAAKQSAVLLSATRAAQADLRQALGVDSTVCLETAIDGPIAEPRDARPAGEPVRILWAGRLRAWKTLPLLLRALARMPAEFRYELRVMGVGACEPKWRELAERLGIAQHIQWIGWPAYAETYEQYRWADAFAFTSMRDTSGTGLLESLASGTPIVAVNHQGAADIVNASCGLLVPVTGPEACINAFAEHLLRLYNDKPLWKRLSDGALAQAERHTWEDQADALLGWYERALHAQTAPATAIKLPKASGSPTTRSNPAGRGTTQPPASPRTVQIQSTV
ncbi:glycosyltransferase family 4 protein [Botrimarina hoheduenensis]|uniref:D-inositol 3-phosphate glycosyltransferase n=1 Tax=Botrimarina hoheduenensis TaxID=2528000 RepID=A0A5C5WE25_9BACT|nr:glycosyltransferase [Botrimarina hoheduenensis]TWT48717.1 D-inositol 3-phosphate glycosyltransferase [Botrimarina hoheduenensis]